MLLQKYAWKAYSKASLDSFLVLDVFFQKYRVLLYFLETREAKMPKKELNDDLLLISKVYS